MPGHWLLEKLGPQSQGAQGLKEGASQRLLEPRDAVRARGDQQPLNSFHPTHEHTPVATHSQPHPLHTYTQGTLRALDPHPGPQECLWIGTQWAGPWQRGCQGGGSSALLLIGCLTGIYPIAIHIHWF